MEEAEYGKRNKKLFPALIERVDYPYGFSRIQTADMMGWKGEPDHPGLTQLLAALRGHLGVGRQPFAANGAIDESRHGDADLRPDGVGRQPFAANGAIDESRHGDADLRPAELSRLSGMDRRNPDSMDGSNPEHPCSL